jgi:hypothetical protein
MPTVLATIKAMSTIAAGIGVIPRIVTWIGVIPAIAVVWARSNQKGETGNMTARVGRLGRTKDTFFSQAYSLCPGSVNPSFPHAGSRQGRARCNRIPATEPRG